MVSLADDLKLALDRFSFAREVGLEPDPWQEDLLRSVSDRVLLNCCRQSGKSTMSGVIALHRALYHPGSLILCLAPALRQSQELFAKVLGFYRDLDRPTPAQAERKLSLELENGSRIVTLPGTDKTIRGFSGVSLLIVDEASRVADELYFAIRPMLAVSGGALIMLTTPHGKRGVFYEEWTGGREWERYEVPARKCPRIPASFLEEERDALPSWVYRQEYECSFEEIADKVAALMREERLSPNEHNPSMVRIFRSEPRLIVDSTGVGVAVSDHLKARGLKFEPVTITAGYRTHRANGTWRVPKGDLVAALEVPFHTGELKIARELELAPTLRKELLNFRRKIDLRTAHDSYEHWREGDHDDLVLAAALACWWPRIRRGRTKLRVIR